MSETKEEKFKRIASMRTNRVIESLRVLGNCSNRNAYGYSRKDADKIFSAIQRQLRETKSKFTVSNDEEFKL